MSRNLVLHHAGDANVPPIRVNGTASVLTTIPDSICIVIHSSEASQLAARFSPRVIRTRVVEDTIHEIINALPHIVPGDTLYISTEPGHTRAYRSARILLAFKGVNVIDASYACEPGTYREPFWLKARDVFRALWYRLTLKYPPRLS